MPIANVKDLRSGSVDISSCTKITADDFHELVRNGCDVRPLDVLLSKDGTIGKVVVYRQPDALVALSSIAIIRPGSRLDPGFLGHVLQSHDLSRQYGVLTGGSALRRLVLRDINRLLVPLPEPDEQIRIAAILDAVDEAIAKTEAVIAKLRHVRTGLLHDLLTRGLDHQGQLRDPVAHPEQFKESRLGPIPKDWDFESVGERLTRIAGVAQTGPFGSQLHSREYTNDGVPVAMPQDILEGTISTAQIARIPATKADELNRHRLRVGDIIFARRGDLSRCASITEREAGWICGTGCLLMRFRDATLSPDWLSLVYRHDIGQRQIAATAIGTTMVNLNTGLLFHLQFAFPHREEQDEIVRRVAQADSNIAAETKELSKLGLMKAGLSTDLLTGRVRVPELGGTTP